MPDDEFLQRIAAARGCSIDVVREIATDCLAAFNEVSYKDGSSAAVALAHAQIGGLAAWHLMGLVVDAADRGDAGGLVRAYVALDPDAARYDEIARHWDAEVQQRTG